MISTRTKIFLATIAQRLVTAARRIAGWPFDVEVQRMKLKWFLDLREGIDFSIYLLGAFERGTIREYQKLIKPGATILDIGANIGAHTLHLAVATGSQGRVIAFEPTRFAFEKLIKNIALNPTLSDRISAHQLMLSDKVINDLPATLYSSWPLALSGDLHPEHRGRLKSTEGAQVTTLDEFVALAGVDRVDFIKLDVDGAEPAIVAGARETLTRYRPAIVMELYRDSSDVDGTRLHALVKSLTALGYSFRECGASTSFHTTLENLCRRVTPGTTVNVVAT